MMKTRVILVMCLCFVGVLAVASYYDKEVWSIKETPADRADIQASRIVRQSLVYARAFSIERSIRRANAQWANEEAARADAAENAMLVLSRSLDDARDREERLRVYIGHVEHDLQRNEADKRACQDVCLGGTGTGKRFDEREAFRWHLLNERGR